MRDETDLPEWLGKAENYTPARDRDAFIDKSILSMLGVLSRIRAQGTHASGRRGAHAEVTLPVTLLLITLLSLARSPAFLLVMLTGLLCRLALMCAEDIAAVLKASLAASAFAALVLLPAGLMGNWASMAAIAPKVFFSVSAVALLARGTRWHSLAGALKVFLLPDVFLFVLDITMKYIFLLGEFALNMLWALRLRSVGRNAGKNASLSGVAGTMFLKSGEMARELHSAMECRGFTGEYRRPRRFAFNLPDGAAAAVAASALLLFLYLR